jgi:hypothetical protein
MSATKFVLALDSFAAAQNSATVTLREAAIAAGFPTWEDAQPIVLQWASKRYNVALVESQSPRNKGQTVLNRGVTKEEKRRFEAAKTAVRYVREALTGDADATAGAGSARGSKGEEIEVPAEIAALAAKLAAACSQYEGAKKLAAQAVAEAFAAK